jgi:hypothetical protein
MAIWSLQTVDLALRQPEINVVNVNLRDFSSLFGRNHLAAEMADVTVSGNCLTDYPLLLKKSYLQPSFLYRSHEGVVESAIS